MRTAILLSDNNDVLRLEERLSQQIDMDDIQLPALLTVMHGECSVHPVDRREFLQSIGYVIVTLA